MAVSRGLGAVICLDSSPGSVPVSPVKPVSRTKSLVKCRKLLFDLKSESEADTEDEGGLPTR